MSETEVYVVLAEYGEYSERMVWVAGVFDCLEAAQMAVTVAARNRAAHDVWNRRYPEPPYELGERFSIQRAKIGAWKRTEEVENGND